LREAAGLTTQEVAVALECSDSKISRIETAKVPLKLRDVRDMLEQYGVDGPERDALIQLAREAGEKDWWQRYYGDLPVSNLVALQDDAASIRSYQESLIYGLLQTEEYARAVLKAIIVDLDHDQIERRVQFRMAHQNLLTREDSPALWVILNEGALRRPVGGRGVMRDQLERLTETAKLPNVTLQVLPFTAGEHSGMAGAFTIVEFQEPADPDVVFLESAMTEDYLEEAATVRKYAFLFDHLRAAALKPTDSIMFINKVAKELQSPEALEES
jgi:transcriptional regulator with XRE-family HTH domain